MGLRGGPTRNCCLYWCTSSLWKNDMYSLCAMSNLSLMESFFCVGQFPLEVRRRSDEHTRTDDVRDVLSPALPFESCRAPTCSKLSFGSSVCVFPFNHKAPLWRRLHQFKFLPGGINSNIQIVHNRAKQVNLSHNKADLFQSFYCGQLWNVTQTLGSRWVLLLISTVKPYSPMCGACYVGVEAHRCVFRIQSSSWRIFFWCSLRVLTGKLCCASSVSCSEKTYRWINAQSKFLLSLFASPSSELNVIKALDMWGNQAKLV